MKRTLVALLLVGSTASVMAQDTSGVVKQTSTGVYQAFGVKQVEAPPAVQFYYDRDYAQSIKDVTDKENTMDNAVAWYQMGDWYFTTHNQANRSTRVFYTPNGSTFNVALPVINSYVPEEVITSVLTKYGNNVYSISSVRGMNDRNLYQVTVIENGVAHTEWLGDEGTAYTAVDVYRPADLTTQYNVGEYAGKDSMVKQDKMFDKDIKADDVIAEDNMVDDKMVHDMNKADTGKLDTSMMHKEMKSEEGVKTKTKIETEDGRELKMKTKDGKVKKMKGDEDLKKKHHDMKHDEMKKE